MQWVRSDGPDPFGQRSEQAPRHEICTRLRRGAAISAASALFLLAQPLTPVIAQPLSTDSAVVERVESLSAEAIALYQDGDYAAALDRFERAIEISPVGNLLFNIGRTLEKLGRSAEALTYYERFVNSPDATPGGITKAEARILALRAQLRKDTATAVVGAPVTEDPPPRAPNLSEPATEVQPTDRILATNTADGSMSTMEVAGWSTLGAGLAVVATAAGLAIATGSEETAFSDATTVAAKQDHRNRAEGFALAADIGFGVGGAAVATGLGLLIASWTTDGEPSTVWIAPQPVASGSGIGIGGRF